MPSEMCSVSIDRRLAAGDLGLELRAEVDLEFDLQPVEPEPGARQGRHLLKRGLSLGPIRAGSLHASGH